MADQGVTFAGRVELPSVVAQTYHHACPFQSCAVSDINTKDKHFDSRTYEPNHKVGFSNSYTSNNFTYFFMQLIIEQTV